MDNSVSIEDFRAERAHARAALRMIREALELHCPPGTIPAEEFVEPWPLTHEAEVLVKAIGVLGRELTKEKRLHRDARFGLVSCGAEMSREVSRAQDGRRNHCSAEVAAWCQQRN